MELADILSRDAVLVRTGLATKADVFKALAETVNAVTGQPAESAFEALTDRESLGSTGLGNGIAVPHGKIAGLTGVTAVFLKLEQPIDFEAVDDQPVDLVMMLLAPVGAGADHLKALARVARVLRTDSIAEALRRSSDADRIYAILTQPMPATKAA